MAYNERIIRIRFNKSIFISKSKLYIHYRRLLSLDQSSYRLVLLFLRQKKNKKKNECNEPHTQSKNKKSPNNSICFSSHQTLNINTGTCKLQVVHEKKWYSLKEKRQPVSLKNPSLKPSSSKQLQLDFLIRRFSLDVSGGKI